MRREWIEMLTVSWTVSLVKSPSMRREWIEIFSAVRAFEIIMGLPPCGGSGLKCNRDYTSAFPFPSPSMRREWIEMICLRKHFLIFLSPSMRREWIEMLGAAHMGRC